VSVGEVWERPAALPLLIVTFWGILGIFGTSVVGLENRHGREVVAGSNPAPSASEIPANNYLLPRFTPARVRPLRGAGSQSGSLSLGGPPMMPP
jgi:hypothetical protein